MAQSRCTSALCNYQLDAVSGRDGTLAIRWPVGCGIGSLGCYFLESATSRGADHGRRTSDRPHLGRQYDRVVDAVLGRIDHGPTGTGIFTGAGRHRGDGFPRKSWDFIRQLLHTVDPDVCYGTGHGSD